MKSILVVMLLFVANGCAQPSPESSEVKRVTADRIKGQYKSWGFEVVVRRSQATLWWDDNKSRIKFAKANWSDYTTRPRCICDLFEGPDGRQLLIMGEPGNYKNAQYFRNAQYKESTSQVNGKYKQWTFKVSVKKSTAILKWDDGTKPIAFKKANWDNYTSTPRCPCQLFEGPQGRQLMLEGSDGNYSKATYYRKPEYQKKAASSRGHGA